MYKLWYLATPYRKYPGGLEAAFDEAVKLTAHLIDVGYEIYSPIVHSHHVAKFVNTADPHSDFWLQRQLPIMEVCFGIFVAKMTGWEESSGIKFEREYFKRAGKIEYIINPSRQHIHPPILFQILS